MEKRYEEREARIAAAQSLIKGLRQGICPCGYMGTISTKGHCFKCNTQWDIYPTAAATGTDDDRLKQWEQLWGPVMDELQKHGAKVGIRLGGSISDWVLALVQERIAATEPT